MRRAALARSLLACAAVAALLGPPAAAQEQLVNRRDEARRAFLATPEGIYRHYCAHCHGDEGRGNGRLWATELTPKPADLTVLDVDKDYLVEAIRDGAAVHGKSNLCPPWGRTISPANIERLAQAVLAFRERPKTEQTGSGSHPRPRESGPLFLVLLLGSEALVLWRMLARRPAKVGS